MDKGLYGNVHPFESGIHTEFHDKKPQELPCLEMSLRFDV